MGLFYPDNDKRKERAISLATQGSDYLFEAASNYKDFKKQLIITNKAIKEQFDKVGLPTPKTTQLDFNNLKSLTDTSADKTTLEITDLVANVASFVATAKWLMPAMSRVFNGGTRFISEETAAKVLSYYINGEGESITVLTVGDLLGGVLGGVISGTVTAAFDLAIELWEEAEEKDKFIEAIHKAFYLRITTYRTAKKVEHLTTLLEEVNTSFASYFSTLEDLKDNKNNDIAEVESALGTIAADIITKGLEKEPDIFAELKNIDKENNVYSTDDPDNPNAITVDYLNLGLGPAISINGSPI